MTRLPALNKVARLSGEEFEELLNQLLIAFAHEKKFLFEAGGAAGPDGGIDGRAPEGMPGMKGAVGFQAKWLSGDLSRGKNASQIRESVNAARKNYPELRHYVVVTPEDISPRQKAWLAKLGGSGRKGQPFRVHHWGHLRLMRLLAGAPELGERYYPESARRGAGAGAGEARAAYLRWVMEGCHSVQLRAIDQGAARAGREALRLEQVYVDLDIDLTLPASLSYDEYRKRQQPAKSSKPAAMVFPLDDGPDGLGRGKGLGGSDATELRRVPALEVLGAEPRLVLLGAPGAGKSTLTSFLTVTLAQAAAGRRGALRRLGKWWTGGALLPVRVILREFAATLEGRKTPGCAQDLWSFLRAELERAGCAAMAEVLAAEAREAGVFFLLDGLDESRNPDVRTRVLEAIADFAKGVGERSRLLVTSRPYAWEQASESLPDWPAAQRLAEFSPEQITAFIDHWFAAVRSAGWLGEADARDKAGALQTAVGRADLAPLARNPLLLTLMATLLANRMRLPDDRADLYDEVVRLLLQRWAETSKADRGLLDALNIPGLTLDHIRTAMQQLAFEAHEGSVGKEGVANILEGDLLATLRPLLGGDTGKADLVLEYIEKRAGLLLNQGPRGRQREYTFPHRTFQEFLAACHLAELPDFASRCVDLAAASASHWREVLVLGARMAKVGRGVPAADALVHGERVEIWLKENPRPDAALEWRRAIVAGEQLLEIGVAALGLREEHRTVHRRVAGWLAALVTGGHLPVVERARAGQVLGRLGDPRPGVGEVDGKPDIVWRRIPAGPFVMGDGEERHTCTALTAEYEISEYPVTVAQYGLFVAAGGYEQARWWTADGWAWRSESQIRGPERNRPEFEVGNHPQVGVSWYEAVAYAAWVGAQLGRRVQLASEAEWERAARGTAGREYPWDPERVNGAADQQCNVYETGLEQTSAVGLFPTGRAECGAADLAGNVWEWTRSLWGSDYSEASFVYPYGDPAERELLTAPDNVARVLRGGSWVSLAHGARCSVRSRFGSYHRNWNVGFRLVASP